MGRLTTHVLDTANGLPAAGMKIEVAILEASRWKLLKTVTTEAGGRSEAPLLEGEKLILGEYRLVFHVAEYFRARGAALSDPPFLNRVPLRFGVADPATHYHVPLLV